MNKWWNKAAHLGGDSVKGEQGKGASQAVPKAAVLVPEKLTFEVTLTRRRTVTLKSRLHLAGYAVRGELVSVRVMDASGSVTEELGPRLEVRWSAREHNPFTVAALGRGVVIEAGEVGVCLSKPMALALAFTLEDEESVGPDTFGGSGELRVMRQGEEVVVLFARGGSLHDQTLTQGMANALARSLRQTVEGDARGQALIAKTTAALADKGMPQEPRSPFANAMPRPSGDNGGMRSPNPKRWN